MKDHDETSVDLARATGPRSRCLKVARRVSAALLVTITGVVAAGCGARTQLLEVVEDDGGGAAASAATSGAANGAQSGSAAGSGSAANGGAKSGAGGGAAGSGAAARDAAGGGGCPPSCHSSLECNACGAPPNGGQNCCVMGMCVPMMRCSIVGNSGNGGS